MTQITVHCEEKRGSFAYGGLDLITPAQIPEHLPHNPHES
jgi:hypothetical protein